MPTAIPTREILWNVHSQWNVIAMYSLFALSLIVATVGFWSRVELWFSGRPAPERLGHWLHRFTDLYRWGLKQKGVNRERAGLFHALIYTGFLVLTFTTTMVLLDHDFGLAIYRGNFYLAVTLLSDFFGAALFVGILLAVHRRYVVKEDRLHTKSVDAIALLALALLVIQGFCLEGLRIHATDDPWARYSPIGNLVAHAFWGFSPQATRFIHFGIWWFHTLTVFLMIGILPYTKLFHIVSSSANLYFRFSGRPKGQLQPLGDIAEIMEKNEEVVFGLGTIQNYDWKHLLDLDACTSCGRCQDACPAYISGKPLSPKWLILDTRNHALSLHAQGKMASTILPKSAKSLDSFLLQDLYLESSGLTPRPDGGYEMRGGFRGSNPLVQESARILGRDPLDRIAGTVMDPDVFWSCTTCMACVEACPVGINHVDQIIGNRRNMVLMEGELPSETQSAMRALENRANPYGPAEERMKWAEGLSVPVVEPGDSVDYLYWVGCVSAYDSRKQKIARSLVTIMQRAGLSFGVLGNSEGCTGDPARRLGEENLYQTLAKKNIELLKSIRFKTLVANCPHCFNTIKNEYPEFGNLGEGKSPEIIHHSTLLKRLLDSEQITVQGEAAEFTFHDPCYLGRYNDEYDAPRDTIRKVKGLNILEMDRSRNKAMCCGAGGGHFWMDMKKGERINTIRVDQALATGAKKIASACPFCMQMLEDGVKLTGNEESVEVKDIAEVVAARLL